MSAKRFHVARPDQLQCLVPMVKDNAITVSRTARIWKIAKAKRGATRWDDGVYVGFSGDRKRQATIVRFTADGSIVDVAALHYNMSLRWCEQNLKPVYD